MSDLTTEVLDELERLEREAMPGRWDFRSTLNNWPAGSEQPETLIEWIENDIAGIDTAGGELMATLRNHARDLIEAARERDRLREALAEARMARRCFDIMARRCWFIDRVGEKWAVGFNWSDYAAIPKLFAAHGTIAEAMALMIEADEWLAKQETEGNSDE